MGLTRGNPDEPGHVETGEQFRAENNPIATYRTEKAAALERWKRRGWTPVTSGRHPLTGPVTRQSA